MERRSALGERRREWPWRADSLLPPRPAKAGLDTDSVVEPDAAAGTDAGSEADAAADPEAPVVNSDQVGRQDGRTATGGGCW
jgi:hypothetical protein